MSLSIFDIAKGISWTETNIYFNANENIDNSKLNLLDYINDSSLDNINRDIDVLQTLSNLMEENDKKKLELHLMNNLHGFIQYDDGLYAFITGATDKSPSVLYDFQKNILFIIHPNLSIKDKLIITPKNLIQLLKTKKQIIDILCINKIQEK